MAVADRAIGDGQIAVYRHPLPTRITHWLNALCLLVLLASGLQILNAHPALYWGNASTFSHPFVVFGSGRGPAFPGWATLPGWRKNLAGGRRWHFFFAWLFVLDGLLYVVHALVSRRVSRVLAPTTDQWRHIGGSIREHLLLRFPQDEAARHYNVLQKLSYLIVVFGLLPLMVATGLTMSPGMDARLHFLVELFGGRQSARTIHFLTAGSLVLFFIVHMIALVAAGPLNEMRTIVTGWFVIRPDKGRP